MLSGYSHVPTQADFLRCPSMDLLQLPVTGAVVLLAQNRSFWGVRTSGHPFSFRDNIEYPSTTFSASRNQPTLIYAG